MSNAFRGQTQYQQSPMGYGGQMGGYGGNPFSTGYSSPFGGSLGGYGNQMGGYGSQMGGYGSPYGAQMGGYGTSFGGYDMGGGYGQPQQQSLVPQYQPSVNDLFSQYFSQQYYGGPAFDPFAATAFFGGGYGGGFGGGMGRRRRRQPRAMPMYGDQLTMGPGMEPSAGQGQDLYLSPYA